MIQDGNFENIRNEIISQHLMPTEIINTILV